ncbi:MAG TPA: MotA/TolQ/ExbB proton channel family protein [Rectinemataceae bacterium]|nr:MotA/TolQ/ExbB proton channel family protein [Rectinemataceae bacterium]
MNLASVLGIPVGIGCLLIAFLIEGGNPASLILPSPIIIIFGGITGALMVSFDMSDVMSIPRLIGRAMRSPPTHEKDLALRFVALAEKSRRDGLLSLEEDMQALDASEDILLKKGLRYVIDGTDSEALHELLENDIAIYVKHRKHEADIFEAAGGFAPTMGIIGTVLGLIIVLSKLNEPDKLGESIAVAFIATLLGIASANLIFLPLANKLNLILAKERNVKEMIVAGVLAIQQGESPKLVGDKLAAYVSEEERGALETFNED